MFACIYKPPSDAGTPLVAIAEQFSPRYERHRDDLVSIDVGGLDRLFGTPHTIGEEIRRTARAHQLQVNVAIADTRTAAMLLAQSRPGLTVLASGGEAAAVASLSVHVLSQSAPADDRTSDVIAVLKTWGIRTLGEFAALPPADLAARLGQDALAWQAIARGEDARPLVPTTDDERFDSTLELEWPIDGLEPLSFVLTRLLEPIVIRLERRDRGAAAIVTTLRLVSKETYARRLELPTPLRDVRALRTLVLLDLESRPPGAAIEIVTVTIEPTPARIVQHTLFTRPTPTPEQLSTLVARLQALMGQERVGAPAAVDSYRPGAFAMKPFAVEHDDRPVDRSGAHHQHAAGSASDIVPQAMRRCRQPVPARVALDAGRPVRVTTERQGYVGGRIVRAAGPWRVSGLWWAGVPGDAADRTRSAGQIRFARDEWDVEIADGTAYRLFRDELGERWFIDAIFD